MKPDYKNWIPKGMLFSLIAGTVLSLVLLLVFGVFGIGVSGKLRVVLGAVFGIAFVVCAKYTQWCVYAYRSFSYDGERKLSKQIIDGTAEQITLPDGGVGLDIGCGSGHSLCWCGQKGAAELWGLDLSEKQISNAQSYLTENGYHPRLYNAPISISPAAPVLHARYNTFFILNSLTYPNYCLVYNTFSIYLSTLSI